VELLEKEEKAIVFIDEFHTIIGAGSTSTSNLDASNILKPLLSESNIRVIGATTEKEFRKYVENDMF